MGCSLEDVWPEPGEDPRFRARREAVAAQSRIIRMRHLGIGLMVFGAIVLIGTLGGLAATSTAWLFGVWFG